jgi:hypothetical protein
VYWRKHRQRLRTRWRSRRREGLGEAADAAASIVGGELLNDVHPVFELGVAIQNRFALIS